MKHTTIVLIIFTFFLLTGCSGSQQVTPVEPAVFPPTKTPAVASQPTVTDTPAPTLTLSPSPTVYISPTATPENFVLADKGYDIADVRLSYPREDMMVVKFKYRLEQNRDGRQTSIVILPPKQCEDALYDAPHPEYPTQLVTGEGEITFKMTIEGVCAADLLEFVIDSDGYAKNRPFLYREFVPQPYRLVRDFPTLNSDTIKIQNFKYTDIKHWSGKFTFDYDLSDEIPLPLEQYEFLIEGFGPGGGCPFGAAGAPLTEHHGKYQIELDLTRNLSPTYWNCLNGLKKYTFTKSIMNVMDLIANRSVYKQELNTPYTTWYDPD